MLFFLGCQTPPAPQSPAAVEICCGGQGAEGATTTPVPGIQSQDLGNLEQGDIFETKFEVKNEGATTLNAGELDFNYPCCVTPTLSFSTLAPGQSGELTVKFDSQFRPGPIDIFIQIPWKGGEAAAQFHLGGTVRESLKVWPTGLNFAERHQAFPIQVTGEDLGVSYEVLELRNPQPTLLKISEPIKKETGLEYTVTWMGEEIGGEPFQLELRTNHPKVPVFPVLVLPPGVDP